MSVGLVGRVNARCTRAPLAVLSTLLVSCAPALDRVTGEKMPPAPAPTGSVLEVTDQMALVCALRKGDVECFGDLFFQHVMPPGAARPGEAHRIDIRSPVVALTSGDSHVCALTVEGNVYCFGLNDAGQFARGWSDDLSVAPVHVPLDEPVVALSAETSRTCALHPGSGHISCWGEAFRMLQRRLGAGVRAPYLMRTPDGAPLVGSHALVGMMAQQGDTVLSLRDPGCSLFPHRSSGVARPVGRASGDLVGATADCARCVVETAAIRCESEYPGEVASIALPFEVVEVRCQGRECCGRGESAGIACWGVDPRFAAASEILDVAVEAFDVGLDIVCFARSSSRDEPCRRVSCVRLPWFATSLPHRTNEVWEVEDPSVFDEAPGDLPLCVDITGGPHA